MTASISPHQLDRAIAAQCEHELRVLTRTAAAAVPTRQMNNIGVSNDMTIFVHGGEDPLRNEVLGEIRLV